MASKSQPIELIRQLTRALELTKIDAERNGIRYGGQSNCVKALRAAGKWLTRDDTHPAPMRRRNMED